MQRLINATPCGEVTPSQAKYRVLKELNISLKGTVPTKGWKVPPVLEDLKEGGWRFAIGEGLLHY